jgi:uncharacterized protein YdeI (YjbR/CyaY-like superfamily)
MQAKFFPTQENFRQWLEENHAKETELLVGFYKLETKKPSLRWSQSVDQALCFGWIDGVRRTIDAESYSIRFTPRRPTSIWSAVNIQKIEDLTKQGLMQAVGLAAFAKRQEHKSKIYAYEKGPILLDETFEKQFKENEKAWFFFQSQAPSYKKLALHWIMSAKQEVTKKRRLEKIITESEAGRRA